MNARLLALHPYARLLLALAANALASTVLAQSAPAPASPTAEPEPAATPVLLPTDPSKLEAYRSDLAYLADPALEGRGPGTAGNRTAAEMIERRFRDLGLLGVFPSDQDAPPRLMQEFTAGRRVSAKSSSIVAHDAQPVPHVPLGFSASADVTAPLVFVGYSIQEGGPNRDYSTFADSDDLSGKIAVLLRFEPMDDQGKSRWRKPSDGPWTSAAGLANKIQAAVKRGAAGILIVNPPGADDPRVQKTETTEGTTRWMRELDLPAALLSPDQFSALLAAVNEPRSALELRTLADQSGGISAIGDRSVRFAVDLDRTPRTTWNVAAVLPGAGELNTQFVVVGAHYDHLGYGYTGGSRSDEFGIVHPGADDNASGTAGLLLIARDLVDRAARSRSPRRSIVLVAFSAEEMGLIGSREFVKASPIESAKISAMVNLDMIGRLRDRGVELSGTGTAAEFQTLLDPLIAATGLTVKKVPGGRGPSDHATFFAAGIPVLHFFTGLHDQYHTPRDTADLINSDGAVRVADLASETVWTIATRPEQLTFSSTSGSRDHAAADPGDPGAPSMGSMKIRFGIAPGNYAEENQGVLVDDVFPGTSAAEAGVQKGDVLVKWNGEPITDVAQWMSFLVKHAPGDIVHVTVKRAEATGGEVVLPVTLKSRDQVTR